MARSRGSIGIDFDGVLHSYTSGWQGVSNCPDPPVPGALEFVRWAQGEGYGLFIYTTRAADVASPGEGSDGLTAVEKWLEQHGFPPLPITHKKLPAILYIDDRGFRFEGDFGAVRKFIELVGTDPWNKD